MRDNTRSAVVAILAISAIAFSAATLNSTVSKEGNGPDGPGSGGGGGDGGLIPPPPSDPPHTEALQVPFLTEIFTVLAGIAIVAGLVYMILYWQEALKSILVIAIVVGLLFLLVQILSSLTFQPSPPLGPGTGGLFGSGGGGSSNTTQLLPLSPIFLLILGFALVGAVVALFRATTDESENPADESGVEVSDAAAVGRAAGRAADRLEQEADIDNEVYRTWREMTDLLDVADPATSTPGEFAEAAVRAGLGRKDVGELTRLFEDVRYGEMQPSDEHERQAITLLRRIESRYTEDE